MRKLYHQTLCPFSRKVRVALGEKKLDFILHLEKPWEGREDFLTLNPAGTVPVFEDLHGIIVVDSSVICEYLEEIYPSLALLGGTPYERAEIRRLLVWFDQKFHKEVTEKMVFEKTLKKQKGEGWPDTSLLRIGSQNLRLHLQYMAWLLQTRGWLGSETFSLADIAAGAHISCLDILNLINWEYHPVVKEWYVRLKSRPSFHSLLNDRVPGVTIPDHYANLDF